MPIEKVQPLRYTFLAVRHIVRHKRAQKAKPKDVPKLYAHFVGFLDNFGNFCATEVFSSEMNSQC